MSLDQSEEDEKALEAYMNAVEGNGPQTTLLALLETAGITLVPPEELNDSDLTILLWRVIEGLADLGAYLYFHGPSQRS
jgi:hypothetical protein